MIGAHASPAYSGFNRARGFLQTGAPACMSIVKRLRVSYNPVLFGMKPISAVAKQPKTVSNRTYTQFFNENAVHRLDIMNADFCNYTLCAGDQQIPSTSEHADLPFRIPSDNVDSMWSEAYAGIISLKKRILIILLNPLHIIFCGSLWQYFRFFLGCIMMTLERISSLLSRSILFSLLYKDSRRLNRLC